jgi:hypothetical protein
MVSWYVQCSIALFSQLILLPQIYQIYRLFLIWGSSWRRPALYPILLAWVATLVAGIGMLHSQAKMPENLSLYSASLKEWLIAVFSLTLFTDIACTALITWRIWIIYHRTKRESIYVAGPSLVPAMVMIIESGALYSLCVTFLLVFYIADSGAHKILLDAVTQLIGVVFSMIIIRVALDLSSENAPACGGDSFGMNIRFKSSKSSQGGTLTEMQFDASANPKLRPSSPHTADYGHVSSRPKSNQHERHYTSSLPQTDTHHGKLHVPYDRSTTSFSSADLRDIGLETPASPVGLDLESQTGNHSHTRRH